MKSKDIKVGTHYAVGTPRPGYRPRVRAIVVAVSVEVRWSSRRQVEVRPLNPDGTVPKNLLGRATRYVPPAHILQEWESYAKEQAVLEEQRKARNIERQTARDARQAKLERIKARLAVWGIKVQISEPHHRYGTEVRMDIENAQRLAWLLEDSTAAAITRKEADNGE